MEELERRQIELVDGANYENRAERNGGFPQLIGNVTSKYAALQAIDSGAGAALLIAVGNGLSIIDEIGKLHPTHTAHPLASNDPASLALIDGLVAITAVGLAATIWFAEWTWAVWLAVVWSLFEASYIAPLIIYDHVYSGRVMLMPFGALILSLNALRGTQARRRGFTSDYTPRPDPTATNGS